MDLTVSEQKTVSPAWRPLKPLLNGSAEAYLLGLWLGDGVMHKQGAFFHVSEDAENAFRLAYQSWCGEQPKIYQYKPKLLTCWSGAWGRRLRELGYNWPCRAADKSIKTWILGYELDLLEGLWQSDGTIYIGNGINVRYGYCRSEALALQIIEVLDRMGVEARIGKTKTKMGKPVWAVNVRRKFHSYLAERMILTGEKGNRLRRLR